MYKKKNIVKKTFISIICVIVMVFSMPVKAKADVIQDLVNVLLRIPDAIMWVSNRYLADRESDEMHINIGLKGVHGVSHVEKLENTKIQMEMIEILEIYQSFMLIFLIYMKILQKMILFQ